MANPPIILKYSDTIPKTSAAINAQIERDILTALDAEAKRMIKDYERSTRTWKHKPKFESVKAVTSSGPELLVGTDDPIYGYVDQGTRPHTIKATKGKRLAFNWAGPGSYKAKTSPGSLNSRASKQTGPTVTPKVVHHPGTKPRNFTDVVIRNAEKGFYRRMEKAVEQALKKGGLL